MSTARNAAQSAKKSPNKKSANSGVRRIVAVAALIIAPLTISVGAATAHADAGTGSSPTHSSVVAPQHHQAFPNQKPLRPAPGAAGRHNPQHESDGSGGNSRGHRHGHH